MPFGKADPAWAAEAAGSGAARPEFRGAEAFGIARMSARRIRFGGSAACFLSFSLSLQNSVRSSCRDLELLAQEVMIVVEHECFRMLQTASDSPPAMPEHIRQFRRAVHRAQARRWLPGARDRARMASRRPRRNRSRPTPAGRPHRATRRSSPNGCRRLREPRAHRRGPGRRRGSSRPSANRWRAGTETDRAHLLVLLVQVVLDEGPADLLAEPTLVGVDRLRDVHRLPLVAERLTTRVPSSRQNLQSNTGRRAERMTLFEPSLPGSALDCTAREDHVSLPSTR